MIGLKLEQAKGGFFDRKKTERALGRAGKRVLSRFGAFVRTRAQSSILRKTTRKGFGMKSRTANRQGVSPPGQPPYSHTGDLAKGILFSYDQLKKAVVVGPIKFNKPGQAPRVLEKGGVVQVKGRARRYRARPYMGPALRAELPQLPALWRNSVRR